MAATRPTLGVDHPTVVPANFDPADADETERESSDEPRDDADE